MNSTRIKAYLALAVCEIIWGASQPIIKPALTYLSSSQFLFLRYLVAAPIVIPLIVQGFRKYHLKKWDWFKIITIEGLGIGNLFLLYTGLHYISAIQSALILQTRPIFITLACILFLSEREEGHEWTGLILSVLGTFVILLAPYLTNSAAPGSFSAFGIGILLLTNVIYTADTLLLKRFYKHLPKATISGIHMWLGLAIFTVYLGLSHQFPSVTTMMRPSVLMAALYMAIPGSVIALTLSYYGFSKIEASEATLFDYLEPFVYIPLAVLWLKESITPFQIFGLLLIGVGVWCAERRPRTRRKKVTQGMPLSVSIRLAEVPLPLYRHH